MDFLLFSFTVFGLSFILVESKIMAGPRKLLSGLSPFFKNLLKCVLCTSFWCGMLVAFLFSAPGMDAPLIYHPAIELYRLPFYGFIGSGVSFFIYAIFRRLTEGMKL